MIRHTITRDELISLLEGKVVHIRSIDKVYNKMEHLEICLEDIGYNEIFGILSDIMRTKQKLL